MDEVFGKRNAGRGLVVRGDPHRPGRIQPDLARGFAATPQPYQFGVCTPGGTSPLCSLDPATVPNALDVITPTGQSQPDELNPTLGPVTLRAVPVP